MSKPMMRPIFVLGIDRSGTSLLSEVLVRWGAHPGEQRYLPEGDKGNPQGYWEYRPMEDFVAELISSLGVATCDSQFKDRLRQQARDPEWRRRALDLAAEMERPDRPWFWKEPDNSFLLPFWNEILADPVYVITLREPTNSGVSYEKLILPPILVGKLQLRAYFLLRWQHLMMTVAEDLKDRGSKIIVRYEDLVTNPHQQCDRIARFLAAEYGPAATYDPARVEEMAETVSPRLWRNRTEVPFLEAENVSTAQKELFCYLSNRLDGDLSDFDPARFPFPEYWTEYFKNISIMRWLLTSL
jgi:hypothetical protein